MINEGAIVIILSKWAAIIRSRVEHKHGTLNLPGQSHSEQGGVEFIGNLIKIRMGFSGMAAWIGEFGKGSLMESSLSENPYLQDYVSDNWNPYRAGKTIRGRPEGEYKDLDGVTQESSGKMQGLSLEKDIGSKDDDFRPIEPMHIIQNEIDLAIPEIIADIYSALSDELMREMKDIFVNKKVYI